MCFCLRTLAPRHNEWSQWQLHSKQRQRINWLLQFFELVPLLMLVSHELFVYSLSLFTPLSPLWEWGYPISLLYSVLGVEFPDLIRFISSSLYAKNQRSICARLQQENCGYKFLLICIIVCVILFFKLHGVSS